MAKVGTINGIGVRASALTPIIYKQGCGRDLLVDYSNMQADARRLIEEKHKKGKELSYIDLEFVACLFWALAYGEDKESVPKNWQDFIDGLDDPLTIYELWPEVIAFWASTQETTSIPKKK